MQKTPGNYGYQTIDLTITTVGQPLRFERSYHSLTTLTDTVVYSRPLGYGWTHNYDINLTFPTDPYGEAETVILKAPHGSRLRFTDNGDGTYEAYPGVTAEMSRLGAIGSYTYVITAVNQTQYTFAIPAGYSSAAPKLTASDGAGSDYFGGSVAISGDHLISGASYDDDRGAAYIFERAGNDWTQQVKLTASDRAAYDV